MELKKKSFAGLRKDQDTFAFMGGNCRKSILNCIMRFFLHELNITLKCVRLGCSKKFDSIFLAKTATNVSFKL